MSNPNFVFVVDGEVAANFKFPAMGEGVEMPSGMAELMAIFSSNPTIVETVDPVDKGSTWDGATFTPPAE